jgi:hypothetical protein
MRKKQRDKPVRPLFYQNAPPTAFLTIEITLHAISPHRRAKANGILVGGLGGIFLPAGDAGPVLTPFLAAAIFAYALNPGVDRCTACVCRRWHAARAGGGDRGDAVLPPSPRWC